MLYLEMCDEIFNEKIIIKLPEFFAIFKGWFL